MTALLWRTRDHVNWLRITAISFGQWKLIPSAPRRFLYGRVAKHLFASNNRLYLRIGGQIGSARELIRDCLHFINIRR